jgi:hypothetical protein
VRFYLLVPQRFRATASFPDEQISRLSRSDYKCARRKAVSSHGLADASRERPLLDTRCLPTNPGEHAMATKPNSPDDTAPSESDDQSGEGTFETDVSETGDDGTTVRQAEVKEDDLSEVKKDQS